MGQGKPLLGSFMSKFLLMVVPGVAASAVAGHIVEYEPSAERELVRT